MAARYIAHVWGDCYDASKFLLTNRPEVELHMLQIGISFNCVLCCLSADFTHRQGLTILSINKVPIVLVDILLISVVIIFQVIIFF